MVVVNDAAAVAFLEADLAVPKKRPGSKAVPAFRKLKWEDATQEQREDESIVWVTDRRLMEHETYCFLHPTAEEEKEIWLDKQYHLRLMLNYILENHGIETYEKIINHDLYKKTFDEYDIDTSARFPHCKYAGGQCDLFCGYYMRGKCVLADAEGSLPASIEVAFDNMEGGLRHD